MSEWRARLLAFWLFRVKIKIGLILHHIGMALLRHSQKYQKRYTITNNYHESEDRYDPPLENRY